MSAEPLSDEDLKLLMLHVERQGQNISFGPSFQSDALRLLATITARDERIRAMEPVIDACRTFIYYMAEGKAFPVTASDFIDGEAAVISFGDVVGEPLDLAETALEALHAFDRVSGSPQTSKGHPNG